MKTLGRIFGIIDIVWLAACIIWLPLRNEVMLITGAITLALLPASILLIAKKPKGAILAFLITIFLLVAALFAYLEYIGRGVDMDFTYERLEDGTYSVETHSWCKKTEIEFPNSYLGKQVTVIRGCNANVTSVVIPEGITTISAGAFEYCDKLENITISNTVTSIYFYNNEEGAFSNTAYYKNENNWSHGALYIGNHLIKVKNNVSGKFEIKDGTVNIAPSAFYNCTSLSGITIPDSVTSIGDGAFYGCTSLTSITIPNSVTYIGDFPFTGCNSLYVVYNYSNFVFKIPVTDLEYESYKNGLSWAKIIFNRESVLFAEDDYEYILADDFLFERNERGYYYLIAYIGIEETVTLPESINGNSYAISRMRGVVNVIIPDSVTSIDSSAFFNCTSLVTITIPDSVTSIDSWAFRDCNSLTDVYYTGTEEEWAAITIGSDNEYLTGATIHYNYVPEE